MAVPLASWIAPPNSPRAKRDRGLGGTPRKRNRENRKERREGREDTRAMWIPSPDCVTRYYPVMEVPKPSEEVPT